MLKRIRNVAGRVFDAAVMAQLPELSRNVMNDRLTYLSPRRLLRINRSLQRVNSRNVAGDILEFGVALGGSSIVLAEAASQNNRRFFGFDVFGMIPPPTSEKDDDKSKRRYSVITSGKSDGIGGDSYYGYRDNLLEDVKTSFAKYGLPIDEKQRFLCRGLFQDTLPSYSGTVALAHIDCDWYDPVKLCLCEISNKLAPGGEIILDDYHDYGGARTAVDEFMESNSARYRVIAGPNLILQKQN